MTTTSTQPIIYIEDEPNDALFMDIAFKRAAIPNPLVVLPDGKSALEYFAGEPESSSAPCLVLLDLNLPMLSGMEVLEWMRQQPHLQNLPVVIYTSSDQPKDQERAHLLGANDYVLKSANVNEIGEIVRGLIERFVATAA